MATATALEIGELMELSEAAPICGTTPARLYHMGCRQELQLFRLDSGRWAVRRREVEALASRRQVAAHG